MEGPQINPLQRGWRADPAVRRMLTSYVVSWMTKAAAIAGRGAGGPMHLAPSFAGTPRLTGADLMHVFLDVLLASRYDVCMHDAAMMASRRGCCGVFVPQPFCQHRWVVHMGTLLRLCQWFMELAMSA